MCIIPLFELYRKLGALVWGIVCVLGGRDPLDKFLFDFSAFWLEAGFPIELNSVVVFVLEGRFSIGSREGLILRLLFLSFEKFIDGG